MGVGYPDYGGSIPACAGEPPAQHGADVISAVYPRVCGGTQTIPDPPLPKRGLSPRVRGNRDTPLYRAGRAGSIPACAGEPDTRIVTLIATGVYPRVCGGTLS